MDHPVIPSLQTGPCPLCGGEAELFGPNPIDGIFRVTCASCQTFDIADDVLTWIGGNAKARNMAHLVASASRRQAKANLRLRIETDVDCIRIAAEEESRQAQNP